MAWVETRGLFVPEPYASNGTTGLALSGAGAKVAMVIQAPKTGTIDRVGFGTTTVTAGDTVDVRLETVDASGNFSGTLWGTNTNVSQVIANADDNVYFECILTAGASVNRGDLFALVIANGAGGGNMGISRGNNGIGYYGIPYCVSAALTKVNCPIASVRYSDGTYPYVAGLYPVTFMAANSFNSGSTPDERGIKFTPDFTCKVSGAWLSANGANAGDYSVILYDSSSSVLASKTMDGDHQVGNFRFVSFTSEQTLVAGTTYRLALLPTTGTNTGLQRLTHRSDAASQMSGSGWNIQETTRTNAGAWTDTANARSDMGVVISAIDAGSRGGGLATIGAGVSRSAVI